MDIRQSLEALDKELKTRNLSFELYICGGAALQLLGIISRATADIDVIEKHLDQDLIAAKNVVAKKLRISEDWLNNKVSPIADRLEKNWKKKCVGVFAGDHLVVFSLSRQDLINSKLHAATSRHGEDINDLVELSPTPLEFQRAKEYTLKVMEDLKTAEVFISGIIQVVKRELEGKNK